MHLTRFLFIVRWKQKIDTLNTTEFSSVLKERHIICDILHKKKKKKKNVSVGKVAGFS
jgi:hypothetical protein